MWKIRISLKSSGWREFDKITDEEATRITQSILDDNWLTIKQGKDVAFIPIDNIAALEGSKK